MDVRQKYRNEFIDLGAQVIKLNDWRGKGDLIQNIESMLKWGILKGRDVPKIMRGIGDRIVDEGLVDIPRRGLEYQFGELGSVVLVSSAFYGRMRQRVERLSGGLDAYGYLVDIDAAEKVVERAERVINARVGQRVKGWFGDEERITKHRGQMACRLLRGWIVSQKEAWWRRKWSPDRRWSKWVDRNINDFSNVDLAGLPHTKIGKDVYKRMIRRVERLSGGRNERGYLANMHAVEKVARRAERVINARVARRIEPWRRDHGKITVVDATSAKRLLNAWIGRSQKLWDERWGVEFLGQGRWKRDERMRMEWEERWGLDWDEQRRLERVELMRQEWNDQR